MANAALNRSGVVRLTNKSGSALTQGAVVILDTANASSFKTTTTAGFVAGQVGVVIEPNGIANDAAGLIAFGVYVPKVTLNTSAAVGDFIKTHTAVGQGTPHAAPAVTGDFAIALTASATPEAILFGSPVQGIGTAITSHSGLSGLGADDHTQYATNIEFDDHNARHEPGGADPMAVDTVAATGSLRTLGTGGQQAAPGNHSHAATVFDFKESVRAATTANITLSGAQTIDGVSVVAGDRVLVKNQTTGADNGIYTASAGAWSRATDADTSAEVTSGLVVAVTEGTDNGDKVFLLTTNDPITLGTTALSFTAIGSGGASSLTVEEADGTPTVANVVKIKVGNTDLTDEGSGVVRVKTAADAAGGGAFDDARATAYAVGLG